MIHNLPCSCRNDICPLDGSCNTKDVVYLAKVSYEENTSESMAYIGMTSGEFRKRFSKHKQSFNNPKYKNETSLSKKVWEIKEEGLSPSVIFKIIKLSRSYNAGDRVCTLCTDEKVEIIQNYKNLKLLNNRKEIFTKCRHKARVKISTILNS